jgi:sec-independent protein translocase protein TatA
MFNMPGGFEWLVILLIALLLFGSRLPSVMRSLGRSVTEFKKGMREDEDELNAPARGAKDDAAAGESHRPAG